MPASSSTARAWWIRASRRRSAWWTASPYPTDGPFAEAKESLAGWWIIEAAEERAVEIASRCVAFTGGPVEVRQVADAPPEV